MKQWFAVFFALLTAGLLIAAPSNDRCQNALVAAPGVYEGETCTAFRDGSSSCSGNATAADVWYQYTPTIDETITATTFGSNYDSVLSVHTGCPGTDSNQIACSDDCGNPGACLTFQALAGTTYWIRVSGFQSNAGRFFLSIARDAAIAGHITDSATGNPVKDIQVLVYLQDSLEFVKIIPTDASGFYVVSGLSPGNYIVRTINNLAYVDELYDNEYCEGITCNPFLAKTVHIDAGEMHNGVDFQLDPGGRVSGTVTDSSTGLPLENIEVHVHDLSNNHITLGFTDAAGSYASFDGLPAGQYLVFAFNHNHYVDELFDHIPCPGASCSGTGGAHVPVALGTVTPIDFALNPGGLIVGTITDSAGGAPISGVQTIVYDSTGRRVTTGSTDSTGSYRVFDGLPTGNYFVRTSNGRSYVDELNPNIPCMAGFCQINNGTAVPVTVGADSQLDFELDAGAVLSGKVQSTSSPLQGILLDILDSANRHLRYEVTDAQGNYNTHVGLAAGNYFVKSLNQTGYIDEIYNNVPCIASLCDVSQGTPVPANAGDQIGNVNFDLDAGGTISGKITDAEKGLPLGDVVVFLATTTGSIQTFGVSDSCGNYTTLHGVPESDYIFRTLNFDSLIDETFDDHLCLNGFCSIATADQVHVIPDTHGIDFSLSKQILLNDEFDDGILSWQTSGGGTWTEANGELAVTAGDTKALATAPLPWDPSGQSGCAGCTIVVRMQNSGKAGILAWNLNKGNRVSLEMNAASGRWRLKQIAGGKVVGHARSRTSIAPGQFFVVKLRYDGHKLSVDLDGLQIMNFAVSGTLSGNLAFSVKHGAASFDSVLAY